MTARIGEMRLERPLSRALFLGASVVCLLGLGAEILHQFGHTPLIETIVAVCSLSQEQNLPTWYSTIVLWSCALVLALHALAPEPLCPRRGHWWGLATGFAYLSLDESMQIHEHLGGWIGTGGLLYFDWVIGAAIAVAAVAALYWRFLWRLPPRERRRFVIAGLIYVGGAVVLELPLGWWTEREGDLNLGYALIDWVEESLEIIGASLFFFALVAALVPSQESNLTLTEGEF